MASMKNAHLGTLEVSRIGLGAMTMAGTYTSEGALDNAESIRTIHRAFDLGVTHIATAEIYGPFLSEEIVGEAVKGRRDEVKIATKFGLVSHHGGGPGVINSSPANVKTAVKGSLKRLGTDHIDLLYRHRVDPNTPIEETAQAVAELIAEGKVLHFGLSEASPETIRRAHAVQPVTALQTEYSLWTRDVEAEILPLLRELGIGFVPYSPLGHGLLTGQIRSADDFADDDWRKTNPRFTGENFRRNLALVDDPRSRGSSPAEPTSPRSPAPAASPASRRTQQPTPSSSPKRSSNDSTTSSPPPAHATTRPTWPRSTADVIRPRSSEVARRRSIHAPGDKEKAPLCGAFRPWRVPDSNRGHHDFQIRM
jgi:aryl-alcohol dehydrogenase-like predicted oxidoreductase